MSFMRAGALLLQLFRALYSGGELWLRVGCFYLPGIGLLEPSNQIDCRLDEIGKGTESGGSFSRVGTSNCELKLRTALH